ncbi:MAG: hypothetical protein ACREBW_09095 [Candidatus Micrarchaeaceae archaeon]
MVGGPITTGNHPKALWPGVHAWWGQVYAEHPEEYTELFDDLTSTQAYEEDVQITGFGLAQVKAEGASVSYDSEIQGAVQRYLHIAYSLGYKVTREELDDNLYEQVSMHRAEANAFSMRQTQENLGSAIYNDAFTGNVFTFATGTTLCSTAQVNTTGGTWSNRLSPDADLSEAALEDISIQAMGLQTDRGLYISIIPESLHVSRQNWYNANRIMKSVLQSGTGNNDINVLKATNAFPKGINMNHYFTNPNAWFTRTNIPHGMQMFWRIKPTFEQDNDFDTKNAKASSYMRLSFGATDPRGILGSNGP